MRVNIIGESLAKMIPEILEFKIAYTLEEAIEIIEKIENKQPL